jgi:glycosyltransferase involved in cell wall biosynthesis/SAM-dependent methyltransferase
VDICTIIAKNYVAQARVLARSFAKHHPDGTCHVLVLDDYEGFIDAAEEPFEILTTDDLSIDGFDRMAAIYDVLELSTAVKPWLLRTLLARDGIDAITYLDPDIEVFAPLDDVDGLIAEHGLVLIPHVTEPMPRDGKKPSETDILIAGVYNLGFIGIGQGAATDHLLDWWAERLETDCRVDPQRGYFVDQRWMDFAPGIVPSLKILRDPGYDVAYWNLPSRELARNGSDEWTVNDLPLRFYHFSGFDPDDPHRLSKHQDRVSLRDEPLLAELCQGYGASLLDCGYRGAQEWEYTYSRLADGTKLDSTMRGLLVEALENGAVRDPIFTEESTADFLGWLRGPAEVGARHGINRYLLALYGRRPDLQRTYPDLDGVDGAGFAGWARAYGAEEVPIPDLLLPPPAAQEEPAGPSASAARLGDPDARRWGVNVVGYLQSELGVGEAARQVISALDTTSVPVAPVGLLAPLSRQGHTFSAPQEPEFPFSVNVLCVNADGLPGLVGEVGTAFRRDRYTIGMWFWEISKFPKRWEHSFHFLDELWVATDHIGGALAPAATVPITKITVPIEPVSGGLLTRERLGLPAGPLFLFTFDYNSVFTRKNPLGLLDAFTTAFPEPGEATLVLKSINEANDESNHAELVAAAGERPDVLLIDRYMSLQEKNSLVAACDCYVSLHRSEGLGITMGEAMYFGKPVIATAYSGNLDFMDSENSLLVDYELVPIGPNADPYPPDGEWADPDLEQAARHMRWVVENEHEARKLGAKAKAAIRTTHSPRAAAKTMLRRLEELRPIVPKRESIGEFADTVMRGVGTGHIRGVVRDGPRDDAGGPRGRARDAVLRAMKPFTTHEKDVDELILTAFDESLGATGRGLEEAHRHAATGDLALRAQLRAFERVLRSEVREIQDDLNGRVDRALHAANEHETRLRRLEPERLGGDRWPPETPWTHEYVEAHRSLTATLLDDVSMLRLFAAGTDLPPGFAVGFDERVVEYPWLFAQRLGGRTLDAGSVLNHAHVLERFRPLVSELVIATLVPEEPVLEHSDVRYEAADLRAMPYEDGSFDSVVCVSTLEHVGLDNSLYGSDEPRAEDPHAESLRAVRELRRVTKPGGRILMTMPYGVAEDLKWVRQVDREEVEAIVDAARPCEARIEVYRYDRTGWQRSTLEEAADARYRDFTADPTPVSDLAAAARAVVCIALACP